ncbi:hypothetical protein KP509_1Z130200 [Ceratopteris richardii]|nr:hypothetical protein KP509_1Z130200 [Ceratopteris richardii]
MECYELQLYSYASFKDALAAGSSSPARQKLSQLKWVSRPTKLRLCTWKACARKAGGRSLDVEGDQNQKKNEEGPLKGLAPLVVVGSANADIYVEIDRLPAPGETIAAHAGRTLPGGKGANQAACAAHLSHPTFFVGQVGEDAHGNLLRQSLRTYGVNLEYLNSVTEPTGHAVVMLQPGGQNSIIIVGGANVSWTRTKNTSSHFSPHIQQLICGAGAILLQREIPDIVNIEAAKIACSANVPVILDVGGADTPIPEEFLQYVSVLSPNETELARLTGAPVNTIEDCIQAARQCQKMLFGP